MKALTVMQPWATLIAYGEKRYETRSWKTHYRGPLVIHAGLDERAWETGQVWREIRTHCDPRVYAYHVLNAPLGCAVAIANLVGCIEMDAVFIASLSEKERAFGYFAPGRYAWELAHVRRVVPVFMRGKQGMWNWPSEGLPTEIPLIAYPDQR